MGKRFKGIKPKAKYMIPLVAIVSLLGTSYGYWGDAPKIETDISTGIFKVKQEGVLSANKEEQGKNEKEHKINVDIGISNDGTIPIKDIKIEKATLTLKGKKVEDMTEWQCKYQNIPIVGKWAKSRCIYLYEKDRNIWDEWHGKGWFSDCEPSDIIYVQPDPIKEFIWHEKQEFIISNEKFNNENNIYSFTISGITDSSVEAIFTYIEGATLQVEIICSSLKAEEGWSDILNVEIKDFDYVWPANIENKDIQTLEVEFPLNNWDRRPEGVLPEVKPSEPEGVLPEVKPSEPEGVLPEVKPSEPEGVLPEVKPSEPEGVLPEVKPSEPEGVLPEVKPSEPEEVLPDGGIMEGDENQ